MGIIRSPILALTSLSRSAKSLLQKPFADHIFRASSPDFKKEMDVERLEHSRERLREIGGETVVIETKNGAHIEGMYIDILKFKEAIWKFGGQFTVNEEGKLILRSFSSDLNTILTDTLRLKLVQNSSPEYPDPVFEAILPLAHLDPHLSIEEKQVTILTHGNGTIFEMNRSRIGSILMSGHSCIVFNIQGTGRSHGAPTEENTYADVESIYYFLRSKGYNDTQITVLGHCLGSGLAAELAARYPVHLVLDRPFAKLGDPMSAFAVREAIKKLKVDPNSRSVSFARKILETVLPNAINWALISYDNHSKMGRVRGSICYIHSEIDQVIPKYSQDQMKEKMIARGGMVKTSDQFDHNDFWDAETLEQYQKHQRTHNTFRSFKETELHPDIREKILSRQLEKERQAVDTALQSKEKRRRAMIATIGVTAVSTLTSGPLMGGASGVIAVGNAATYLDEQKTQH
jgi:pimeloyl-ACP methyl ester carboxylesterase